MDIARARFRGSSLAPFFALFALMIKLGSLGFRRGRGS